MKRILALSLMLMFLLGMTACAQTPQETSAASERTESSAPAENGDSEILSSESTAENAVPAPEGKRILLRRIRAIRDSDVPREENFAITKLYPSQFDDPEAAIQLALDTLDIGYIDMMLLHHPGDGDVEAYLAMEQAVADGKIHSICLSNWSIEEPEEFLPQVNITPALVQNEIHPYYQEPDGVSYIQELGITVQGWYPFGGRGHTSELLGDETISAIAESHGVTSAQVILRWNLHRGVVVIPGSSNPDHIRENFGLFGFELTDEEMAQIAALNRDEKHDWY